MSTRRTLIGTIVVLALLGALIAVLQLLGTAPDVTGERGADVAAPSAAAALPETEAKADPILAPAPERAKPAKATPPPAPAAAVQAAPGPAPLVTFHLLVVDGQSQPVPRALVETWRRTGETQPREQRPPESIFEVVGGTHADDAGRCAVSLQEDVDFVFASADGVGTSGLNSAVWLAASRNLEGVVVLVLHPMIDVEGVVLDAGGGPVSGASVRVRPSSFLGHGQARPLPELTTRSDGRFAARVDASDQVSAQAMTADGRTAGATENGAPGATVTFELRLPGDWIVEGVVQDEAGQPVADAVVAAVGVAPDGVEHDGQGLPIVFSLQRKGVKTAADGSFSITLERPGDYDVSAGFKGKSPPLPQRVSLAGPAARRRLTLVLRPTRELTGWVVSPVLDPLPRFDVELRVQPPALVSVSWGLFEVPEMMRERRKAAGVVEPRESNSAGLSREASARTNSDGRFRFAGLPPDGVFEVRACIDENGVQRPRDVPWVPVPPGATDIILVASLEGSNAPPASLRVTALSAATGQPLTAVQWNVMAEGSAESLTMFRMPVEAGSADGSFVVPKLKAGQAYTLVVEAEGHAALDLHGLVATLEGTPVVAHLPRPGGLDVEVVDARGLAVAAAPVQLRRSFELPRPPLIGLVPQPVTDSRGLVRFETLAPGRYTASIEAAGGKGSGEVEVADGQFARIRVVLAKD